MKTMKRIVCMLLVMAMLASLPVAASAASYNHVHTYAVKETKAATCSADGYTLYACNYKGCTASYKTNIVLKYHSAPVLCDNKTDAHKAHGEYVAGKSGQPGTWKIVCNDCKAEIQKVTETSCNTKWSSSTVVKTDSNGNTETVTDGGTPVYAPTEIKKEQFASGSASFFSKVEVDKDGNTRTTNADDSVTYSAGITAAGFASGTVVSTVTVTTKETTKTYVVASVNYKEVIVEVDGVEQADMNKYTKDGSAVTKEEFVADVGTTTPATSTATTTEVKTETDGNGNQKITTTVDAGTPTTEYKHADGTAALGKEFASGEVDDTKTVVTYKDEKGNKKITTGGGTPVYKDASDNAITEKGFASGTATVTSNTHSGTATLVIDPAKHGTLTTTIVRSAKCTSSYVEYSTQTCGACGLKMGKITGTAVTDETAKAHSFPTTGDYVVDGKKYTIVKEATASADGYALRTCDDCSRIEMVVIPKKEVSYYSATTKKITSVYCDADKGDVQTVSGLKIGNLPSGAKVLVVEKRGSYAKIEAKNSTSIGNAANGCWVLQSDLNISSTPSAKNTCTHSTKEVIYESLATCQFAKMVTEQCKECKVDYEFKVDGKALAHKDTVGNDWEVPTDVAAFRENFKIENDKAWVITKQPTETEPGEMKRVCKDCGYTEYATGATSDPTKKFTYLDVKILRATGIQNEKAYVTVAVAEVFDKYETDPTLTHYAVKGSNVTVMGYSVNKTWAKIKSAAGEGWTKTSNLKIGATGSMAASYDGAIYYGIVASGSQPKVRLSYSETSSVISTIPSGTGITVYELVESSGVWGRIESKTADKWVKLGTGTLAELEAGKKLSGMKTLEPLFVTYSISTPVATLVEPIAEGHVTSTIGLTVRQSATVQSKKLGELAYDATNPETYYIYEVKTVNGVDWALVKSIDDGATFGVKVTKADLEKETTKLVDGWICMTYFALDTEISTNPASGASKTTYSGVVTTGGIALNVRKSADIYSDKIGSLANGTNVTIYNTKKASNGVSWGRISQDSLNGWVCMQYVTLNSTTTDGTTTAASEPNASVVNCATAVNVRNKADISGTQVGQIPVGSRIAITKTSNGWGYVESRGWVYLQYVSFDAGALENLNKPAASTTESNEAQITTFTNVTVPATVIGDTPVYSDHNTGSTKLMTLKLKDTINVIDRAIVSGAKWYKISEGSVTGWINNIANIKMEAISGTVKNTLNVYASASVDSNVNTVLGAGSKFSVNAGNDNHFTEGVYAWAQLASGAGWIQLHLATLDSVYNATFEPTYADLPAITGTTVAPTIIYKSADKGSEELVELEKDVEFTILDWKYESTGSSSITWGKISQGQYTGWIILQEDENLTVEQVSIGGTVTSEILNLYNTAGDTTDVQRVLRKGDKVIITERRLIDNTAWGRMVSAKDTSKVELWANLAGVQLDGQKANTPATTPAVTPTVTPTAPSTITIGVVVGADSVNVRSDAHVSSALVATVKKGEQVRVSEQKISDGANWGKIDQGWIAMQYVSLNAATQATNATTNVATGTTIMTSVPAGAIAAGFTNIENLAVRANPGVAQAQVGSLPMGSSVVISQTQAANGLYWGKTDAGWICMSYVTCTAVGTAGSGTAGTIARCFSTVNVRSNAGTNNAITAKIMVSSPVQILETTTYSGELWGRTNLGWVAMQYVA